MAGDLNEDICGSTLRHHLVEKSHSLRKTGTMKTALTTLVTIFFVFLSSPSWSEGTSIEDLVKRDGLAFKKFTDVPFTGEVVEGPEQGKYKNGKKEGQWFFYKYNEQLSKRGYYKNGWKHGPWIEFYDTRQLLTKGEYKNGRVEGLWVLYYVDGILVSKGKYKDGHMEGRWVVYHQNGNINKEYTGTYKNDKKISD